MLSFACAAPAAAQDQSPSPCASETTTLAMGQCLRVALHEADSTLALYYDTALRRAAAPAALRRAQVQWTRFRDADCDAIGAERQGGSLGPLATSQCRLDLARERTHELWDIYIRITENPLPEPGLKE
jgi:uncharacterized protein YecT (DUF1311 family)